MQLILTGGIYLPENALVEVAGKVPVSDSSNTNRADHGSRLSDRQTAVLLRAIQGQPNKVIARELGIAQGTVKAHLSAVYRVLGVNNRTEAVYAAAKLGLRPPLQDIG